MLYYSASVSWRVWLGVSLTVHESGRSGLNGKLGMIEFVYGVCPSGWPPHGEFDSLGSKPVVCVPFALAVFGSEEK